MEENLALTSERGSLDPGPSLGNPERSGPPRGPYLVEENLALSSERGNLDPGPSLGGPERSGPPRGPYLVEDFMMFH